MLSSQLLLGCILLPPCVPLGFWLGNQDCEFCWELNIFINILALCSGHQEVTW